mmetsp:Transcript_32048/g.81340  ORF Transcript_32048/g.81340 Transcript_32048/m.81340 type:complete len:381 (-) Transcript_32048:313-1455(-)
MHTSQRGASDSHRLRSNSSSHPLLCQSAASLFVGLNLGKRVKCDLKAPAGPLRRFGRSRQRNVQARAPPRILPQDQTRRFPRDGQCDGLALCRAQGGADNEHKAGFFSPSVNVDAECPRRPGPVPSRTRARGLLTAKCTQHIDVPSRNLALVHLAPALCFAQALGANRCVLHIDGCFKSLALVQFAPLPSCAVALEADRCMWRFGVYSKSITLATFAPYSALNLNTNRYRHLAPLAKLAPSCARQVNAKRYRVICFRTLNLDCALSLNTAGICTLNIGKFFRTDCARAPRAEKRINEPWRSLRHHHHSQTATPQHAAVLRTHTMAGSPVAKRILRGCGADQALVDQQIKLPIPSRVHRTSIGDVPCDLRVRPPHPRNCCR